MDFSDHLAVLSSVDLSSVSYSTTATRSEPARIPFSSFDRLNFAFCSNLFSVSINFDEIYVENWFACFDKILHQFLERKPPINTAVDFCDRLFNKVNFDLQMAPRP